MRALLLTLAVCSLARAQPAENPYGPGEQWGHLPDGRTWGSSSGIYPHKDSQGKLTGKIWVFERCGKGSCIGSDLDPILLFNSDGTLIRSFGSGRFIWPHGIHVDSEGNVWVADAVETDCKPGREDGRGHQVHKFTPEGELLMTLGKPGVRGEDKGTFSCPSDVLVLPDGDILVSDGHNHGHGGNNRLVKFSSGGQFEAAWGEEGSGPGQFLGIHALAMDSRDRIFVGDRANQRIQILDQQGRHIATWRQFGSPSDIYIDDNDTIYVADSDSGFDRENTGKPRNPGYLRGIYIGSARTGEVTGFIPDPKPNLRIVTSGAEGVISIGDYVYGAQVAGSRGVLRYEKKQP